MSDSFHGLQVVTLQINIITSGLARGSANFLQGLRDRMIAVFKCYTNSGYFPM